MTPSYSQSRLNKIQYPNLSNLFFQHIYVVLIYIIHPLSFINQCIVSYSLIKLYNKVVIFLPLSKDIFSNDKTANKHSFKDIKIKIKKPPYIIDSATIYRGISHMHNLNIIMPNISSPDNLSVRFSKALLYVFPASACIQATFSLYPYSSQLCQTSCTSSSSSSKSRIRFIDLIS